MKRRKFVKTGIAAGIATSALGNSFGPYTAQAYAQGPAIARAARLAGSDRILVVVQLNGGNDGLNTVVPYKDDLYHSLREDLAIENPLPINDTLGWHPAMSGFESLYNEGEIAIVQNVGYDNPNRSHFRSIDIWFTGGNNNKPPDENTHIESGWMGRYLDVRFPGYPTDPSSVPDHPMAIEIGTKTSLMLKGPNVGMSLAIYNPDTFYRIIAGTDISGGDPPDTSTPAGLELEYIRNIALEANHYAKPVRDAADNIDNNDVYPSGNDVAERLKVIARLIGGGLETPVYAISQVAYDTHAQQDSGTTPRHTGLVGKLSSAIKAFYDDLKIMGVADRVILMTVSEFGRRVKTNGTAGTDHGTAAPMFFVGPKVHGGVYGDNPDLSDLDRNGDLKFKYHFKQMYASVLHQWFGTHPDKVDQILLDHWDELPLFNQAPVSVNGDNRPAAFALDQNYPNPLSRSLSSGTTINYLVEGGQTNLTVYDIQGRLVKTLVNGNVAPGHHQVRFNPARLSSGTYIYRLESRGMVQTRSMIVTK